MNELRREAIHPNAGENRPPGGAETLLTDHEKRHKERREGLPPPWIPTIFLAAPARLSPIDCGPITRALLPCRADRAPEAFGGSGHLDVTDAERGERVDQRVADRR